MSQSSLNVNQMTEQGSKLSVLCRICYDADSREELITPCRCKGTVAYVHRSCLETWLAEANATNCELCHQTFQTERTPKYTALKSIWKWLKYQPTANDVGRGIIGDLLACSAITPMAIIITYVCLFSSDYYNQKKYQSPTAAKWTSVSLLVMIGIMLVGYYMWVFSIIRLHMNVWYNWWQRECIVRFIAPTQYSRIAEQVRMIRRESTTVQPSEANVNREHIEIVDVETVESHNKALPVNKSLPAVKPIKTTSAVVLAMKHILPTIEEGSETVITVHESSSRNVNLFLSGSARLVVERSDEENEVKSDSLSSDSENKL
ncbi:hypothetical protein WA026_006890 [Henosepilachna vigintioctopunctata]|uniref:RING-CH-type domain-containing protein n=1 Tax=Henosepilachna vigintioctopunctata TaxID=420089 RepID=A0AAW1VBX1_9CUCU